MAFIAPDYTLPIEGPVPSPFLPEGPWKYEKTSVGEMQYWELGPLLGGIFDVEKQERMRMAQGLYTSDGKQSGDVGKPTDYTIAMKMKAIIGNDLAATML